MLRPKLNGFLAAALAVLLAPVAALPLRAEEPVERLLEELRQPEQPEWPRVEADLARAWSKSGSAAMDLLYERGRDAMEAGEAAQAIEHLTALTDHAPDFAQGWNALASAYFRAGQYGPAVEAIGRALALNPNQYESLTGLGIILEETGNETAALAAFRAARSIHPHQPTINEALERLDRKLSGHAL